MNIFVASLNFRTDEDALRDLFEEYGTVDSARIITDKFTGRSKGFGFVEMENDDQEDTVVKECNRKEINERNLVVAKAHSRKGYNERS